MKHYRKTSKIVIILMLLGILTAIRSGFTILRLIEAGGQVDKSRLDLEKLSLEKQTLEKRLEEVSKDSFVEKEAREKLGFGLTGEQILIMPKSDGLNPKFQIPTTKTSQEVNKPNWRKWLELI